MKRKYNVKSHCCKAPILWNVISNDEKTGICTKFKKWARVIEKQKVVNVYKEK